MNKQELIELLKNAEAGSDELNVAYYEWKYPDHIWHQTSKGKVLVDGLLNYIVPDNVTNSVDAALGEIPYEYKEDWTIQKWQGEHRLVLGDYDGDMPHVSGLYHKSLPIAILLAVVEASE